MLADQLLMTEKYPTAENEAEMLDEVKGYGK
jgi:hypothetical protein